MEGQTNGPFEEWFEKCTLDKHKNFIKTILFYNQATSVKNEKFKFCLEQLRRKPFVVIEKLQFEDLRYNKKIIKPDHRQPHSSSKSSTLLLSENNQESTTINCSKSDNKSIINKNELVWKWLNDPKGKFAVLDTKLSQKRRRNTNSKGNKEIVDKLKKNKLKMKLIRLFDDDLLSLECHETNKNINKYIEGTKDSSDSKINDKNNKKRRRKELSNSGSSKRLKIINNNIKITIKNDRYKIAEIFPDSNNENVVVKNRKRRRPKAVMKESEDGRNKSFKNSKESENFIFMKRKPVLSKIINVTSCENNKQAEDNMGFHFSADKSEVESNKSEKYIIEESESNNNSTKINKEIENQELILTISCSNSSKNNGEDENLMLSNQKSILSDDKKTAQKNLNNLNDDIISTESLSASPVVETPKSIDSEITNTDENINAIKQTSTEKILLNNGESILNYAKEIFENSTADDMSSKIMNISNEEYNMPVVIVHCDGKDSNKYSLQILEPTYSIINEAVLDNQTNINKEVSKQSAQKLCSDSLETPSPVLQSEELNTVLGLSSPNNERTVLDNEKQNYLPSASVNLESFTKTPESHNVPPVDKNTKARKVNHHQSNISQTNINLTSNSIEKCTIMNTAVTRSGSDIRTKETTNENLPTIPAIESLWKTVNDTDFIYDGVSKQKTVPKEPVNKPQNYPAVIPPTEQTSANIRGVRVRSLESLMPKDALVGKNIPAVEERREVFSEINHSASGNRNLHHPLVDNPMSIFYRDKMFICFAIDMYNDILCLINNYNNSIKYENAIGINKLLYSVSLLDSFELRSSRRRRMLLAINHMSKKYNVLRSRILESKIFYKMVLGVAENLNNKEVNLNNNISHLCRVLFNELSECVKIGSNVIPAELSPVYNEPSDSYLLHPIIFNSQQLDNTNISNTEGISSNQMDSDKQNQQIQINGQSQQQASAQQIFNSISSTQNQSSRNRRLHDFSSDDNQCHVQNQITESISINNSGTNIPIFKSQSNTQKQPQISKSKRTPMQHNHAHTSSLSLAENRSINNNGTTIQQVSGIRSNTQITNTTRNNQHHYGLPYNENESYIQKNSATIDGQFVNTFNKNMQLFQNAQNLSQPPSSVYQTTNCPVSLYNRSLGNQALLNTSAGQMSNINNMQQSASILSVANKNIQVNQNINTYYSSRNHQQAARLLDSQQIVTNGTELMPDNFSNGIQMNCNQNYPRRNSYPFTGIQKNTIDSRLPVPNQNQNLETHIKESGMMKKSKRIKNSKALSSKNKSQNDKTKVNRQPFRIDREIYKNNSRNQPNNKQSIPETPIGIESCSMINLDTLNQVNNCDSNRADEVPDKNVNNNNISFCLQNSCKNSTLDIDIQRNNDMVVSNINKMEKSDDNDLEHENSSCDHGLSDHCMTTIHVSTTMTDLQYCSDNLVQENSEETHPSLSVQKERVIYCTICDAKAIIRCTNCKSTCYCSISCQKKHWSSGHMEACFKLKNNL